VTGVQTCALPICYAGETSLAAVRERVLASPPDVLIALSAASRRESFDR